ncbi:alpha/beta hydrolase [Planctomycetes bacterium K23_9]|uniref:Acetylxylan esterase n=1 Tax=Stieleria marina TaxID=1930275 RepID=A0A517NNB5_9BACT|nr:Acetylxylan esterase precursor [Planctomycetes bacterium K23_9]
MNRLVTFLTVLAFAACPATSLHAESPQAPTPQPLWANGAPDVTATADGDVPELLITQVESKTPTAAIVILPGGGYGGHAMGHEGYEFATWFQSMGISSAICTYRLRGKGNHGKGYGHPAPMMDAQRAIQTLRARAEALNIDPKRIGVIGFSAGGHLASTVSTKFLDADPDAADPIARVSSRPDFSILCYPVIGLGKPYTHKGSQRNLLGADASAELIASLSNEDQVSQKTPPTFLFHTEADKAVPVENSLQYYEACKRHGVSAELHVFPEGRHGLGLARDIPGANQWPQLCEAWLDRMGMK